MSTLAAQWDMRLDIGMLWERQFIVEDENITTAALQFVVRRSGDVVPIIDLTVGAGIAMAYGTYVVGGETIVGTLVTLSRTPAATATYSETTTARHGVRNTATGEYFFEGNFEIRKTAFNV